MEFFLVKIRKNYKIPGGVICYPKDKKLAHYKIPGGVESIKEWYHSFIRTLYHS